MPQWGFEGGRGPEGVKEVYPHATGANERHRGATVSQPISEVGRRARFGAEPQSIGAGKRPRKTARKDEPADASAAVKGAPAHLPTTPLPACASRARVSAWRGFPAFAAPPVNPSASSPV